MKNWASLVKRAGLLGLASLFFGEGFAQATDFGTYRKEMNERFDRFQESKQKEFDAFRDSLNEAYTRFLEQKWESFSLFRQERSFRPMPEPPVYTPESPLPDEGAQPPVVENVPVAPPEPVEEPPVPEPVIPQPLTVSVLFFGTPVQLQPVDNRLASRLANASEREVASFWLQLSGMPVGTIAGDIRRISRELCLDDWGVFQLVREMAAAYIPDATENERVVFSVFMLNQLGKGAKIGRSGNDLYALLASRNMLSNTSYFVFGRSSGGMRYYVINASRKELHEIQTCNAEYGDGGQPVDFAVSLHPRLSDAVVSQALNYAGCDYTIPCNRNLVDYYATYPCVDFEVYATAPIEEQMLEALKHQLEPCIGGKPQLEAVNYLLHFVQNAFRYQTDQEQYGYEKWNFAEETLVSACSDCDDRAIFFAQLVRNLLGLETVLVHYPGVHLATAVRFADQGMDGDYVTVDGSKYFICDPTYINADAGMAMPDLRHVQVEIVEL